jgi:Gnt-I system high-affinity gluconate transporter
MATLMTLVTVVIGIGILLILIMSRVKPFVALLITSFLVGCRLQYVLAQEKNVEAIRLTLLSIGKGFYDTITQMAFVVMLGALLGKIIESSGAATRITRTLTDWVGVKNLPWAIMLTGFIIGIPLFYNAGFVLLVPLVFSLARTSQIPLLLLAIPMASALSVTHGFLPPHPAPTAIAYLFQADVGLTLLYGLVLAIPTVILAGPLFSRTLSSISVNSIPATHVHQTKEPGTRVSFLLALLPVFIITFGALASLILPTGQISNIIATLTRSEIALLLAVILSLWLLVFRQGFTWKQFTSWAWGSQKEILMILLVIAAGGSFKQVLIDGQVGAAILEKTSHLKFNPLLMGWLIAALLRVSLGSATVAALTAGGMVIPLVEGGLASRELMVLAVGSGSLMFSHINDTGFWMFKEYFNLTLAQTFRSWSLMETIVSVMGLLGVLALSQWVH